jgi:acyl carrier protein
MSEMQHNDVLKKLESTFREVFDNDDIRLTDDTTAADIEEWDSLTNIRVLIQIEQDFDISFSSSDIADIPNVGELVNLILTRL